MPQKSEFESANRIRESIVAPNLAISSDKAQALEQMLIALIADGHILLDDQPGSGKTLLANVFSNAMDLVFRRIQFTADLMPMDILGWESYASGERELEFQPGPIFSNFLLADQLNYSSPKVQSALFEVMQERKVTVKGESYEQLKPFMVCATRSPTHSETDGYDLVPNQLDRFLMRIPLGCPTIRELQNIINWDGGGAIRPYDEPLADAKLVLNLQRLSREIAVDEKQGLAIAKIIASTRESEIARQYLRSGLSIRAALALKRACQARALLFGRPSINQEDINKLLCPVLGHRLLLNFEAEAEGRNPDDLIQKIAQPILE